MIRIVSLMMVILLLSCFQGFAETNTEKEQRNIAALKSWALEVWGKGNLELVPDLVAPQYVRHDNNGTRTVTPESYSKEIVAGRARGVTFDNDAFSADGDLVWTRWTMHGKGEGDRPFTLKGLQIYRFDDGKIAETWTLTAPGNW